MKLAAPMSIFPTAMVDEPPNPLDYETPSPDARKGPAFYVGVILLLTAGGFVLLIGTCGLFMGARQGNDDACSLALAVFGAALCAAGAMKLKHRRRGE